ncbi:hypothetical protein CRE_15739 [Caenorhabditis remanei]|uniref:Uncharacterized protein n=1 Tax=Caenorhabditis remanei TaxID=31234 RepID=E3NFC3_CAERE|nr:hypothetical protein CRE_15739 [Caenorhabditis remanei]
MMILTTFLELDHFYFHFAIATCLFIIIIFLILKIVDCSNRIHGLAFITALILHLGLFGLSAILMFNAFWNSKTLLFIIYTISSIATFGMCKLIKYVMNKLKNDEQKRLENKCYVPVGTLDDIEKLTINVAP